MVYTLFIKKQEEHDVVSKSLFNDLTNNLQIKNLKGVNTYIKYLVGNISKQTLDIAITTVFSEPPVDIVYRDKIHCAKATFAYGLMPGQFDQRAESAVQCIKLISPNSNPIVKAANVVELVGKISNSDLTRVKNYLINKVDSIETPLFAKNIKDPITKPQQVKIISNFNKFSKSEINTFHKKMNFAMSIDDLIFTQKHFQSIKRLPTETELKVIDTYWSDHCRHTTFESCIDNVEIAKGKYNEPIINAYHEYLNDRKQIHKDLSKKPITLMDIATIGAKWLKKNDYLKQLDVSDENNACSINVDVLVGKQTIPYLLMFKNETHNHPTEIEPFGGAATCLGGAIRDPLSGRAYVYQAMRVTGAADPTTPINKTLPNKLAQRIIVKEAARGYSSYGNQIGLATGQVDEVYHDGYVAKRLEVGAVIAATPKANVIRSKPTSGDVVILLGGRTGRDGIGGATGSSKSHTTKSVNQCGAEVQKGNAICERKIQRLFMNKQATRLIKKCNDFGAGGVCVAIGELCDGLDINLDAIPKKYQGLNATELAISESQERMAVVVSNANAKSFIELAEKENLEATIVANVTNTNHLRMFFNKKPVVNLSREFLNTNGIRQHTGVKIGKIDNPSSTQIKDIKKYWLSMISDLNVCSKQGLTQMFDASIGANTVLWPLGGKYKSTPAEGMAALIPSFCSMPSSTTSLMAYGFNPYIGDWSCFHMGYYSVVESISKIVAMGGDYKDIYLSLQEYFPKLGNEPTKWAKPFMALLGAYQAQKQFKIGAIGGKDSMSGTYENIEVPSTLISFATTTTNPQFIISPEFKEVGSSIIFIKPTYNDDLTINHDSLIKIFNCITNNIKQKHIISAYSLKQFGIAEGISKMCFGNKLGCIIYGIKHDNLFKQQYGAFILEIKSNKPLKQIFANVNYQIIGNVTNSCDIVLKDYDITLPINQLIDLSNKKLANIYNYEVETESLNIPQITTPTNKRPFSRKVVKHPLVVIPVFPGTNCEFDTQNAFLRCGARVQQVLIRNQTSQDLLSSINELAIAIKHANILVLPGGFSAADEPDGSAKFIVNVFHNEKVKQATHHLLAHDGLILGICNGFQALIKLGLLTHGKITKLTNDSPTLTYNKIHHHVSDIVRTKVVCNKSPWLSQANVGKIVNVAVSHGEGNFVCSPSMLKQLIKNEQIALQYVDADGNPSNQQPFNPNGSVCAIEAITSVDGRILGKMGHCERIGKHLYKNVPGDYDLKLFESGVKYFTHK